MTLFFIRQAKFVDFSSCKPFSSADLSFRMIPAHAADLEIDSAMTLNQAKVGCDVQIRLLNGPGCERLRDLGFCEQLQVRKIAGGRNLICSICGTRMAISRELAEQVLVSPVV